MNKEQMRRWGLIGLVLLAVVGAFWAFMRYQQRKRQSQIPPDDRIRL